MNELAQRVSAHTIWLFVGMVALLSLWETFAPRRPLFLSTPRRWLSHLSLYLLVLLAVRLTGIAPLAFAIARSRGPQGLLSRQEVPWAVRFFAALLIIDLMRYALHRLEHNIPWLWKIHLLHHSDRDFDFTNDLRFHPLDTALQIAGTMLLIWILAPLPLAVALADVLAIAVGMFSHSNVELPAVLERTLRWVFVTPGLHQIHHSLDGREQGRNLGVTFSWWDRLFGTFAEAPALGLGAMRFGVEEVDAAESLRPLHMILAPFRNYTPSNRDLASTPAADPPHPTV
jgi:sterol desaturase/sphingolipid hydroxylase (fatty acid hydroxylase superfamily)